ncbi:hypothetical protein lbkm_1134 [Lachnospiraceae bacterium KM106-2]|nr:hypothetical protein lbkm_1134 [Lachnospiraceae bacterium KM106-2]
MIQSRWLEREINEYELMQEEARRKTPKTLLGLVIFFCILLAAIFCYGQKNPDYNTAASMGIVGGMGAFILLICLLSLALHKKKKGLPELEQMLQELLTTPETIDEFDNDMLSEPLLRLSGTPSISFREHYLVEIWGRPGQKLYSFTRLDEIQSTRVAVSRDNTSVTKMGKIYDMDILDRSGHRLTGFAIRGKKNMAEFEEALVRFCPGIQLAGH